MTYIDILESYALTEEFKNSSNVVNMRLLQALRELAQLLDSLDHLNIEKQPTGDKNETIDQTNRY